MLNAILGYFGFVHAHSWGPWESETHKTNVYPPGGKKADALPLRVILTVSQRRQCATCKFSEYDVEKHTL